PPTIGLDSLNGVELTVPYYWNIAPNRDATFYPTLMSKRGVDLAGEFRYLERDYAGQVRADLMPNDSLRARPLGLCREARCDDRRRAADRPLRTEPQPEPGERRQLLARLLPHHRFAHAALAGQ